MPATLELSRSERTIVNLLTSAVAWGWPALLAFFASPLIVRGLGNDAYGIRGLVVSITGYFALLDLGLNGAVTKYLAEYRAQDDKPQITELLGTTLTTCAIFGVVGGIVIWILAGWFTTNLFVIPPELHKQAIWTFRLTGVGFFLSMLTWWASSIPTGMQRFDVFNGVSIGFGTLTTLGTVAAVLLGYGLIGVVVANLLSNMVAIVAYGVTIRRLMPDIALRFSFEWAMFRRTVLFGLYMVGFRIFALLFSQLDSMLIGVWIGSAAIAFYIVPQQIAQVIHGINGKMMQIIFPMASEFSAAGDRVMLRRMFLRGFNLSLVVGLSVAVPLAVMAGPLLRFWISPEFTEKSFVVLELLIVAFLVHGLSAMPSSALAGIGYPQVVTIGAFVVGLSGLLGYWLLIPLWGIDGAALAKLISVTVTVAFYLVMSVRFFGVSLLSLGYVAARPILIGVAVWVFMSELLVARVASLLGVLFAAALVAAVFGVACWYAGVFDASERNTLRHIMRRWRVAVWKTA